jgi:hypothetical protein
MIKMNDDKEYCCEGNAYLQSAFDKLILLHEKTVHIQGTLGNPDESKFFDNECELWTLRSLIKNCPWCKPNELKIEDKKSFGNFVTFEKILNLLQSKEYHFSHLDDKHDSTKLAKALYSMLIEEEKES